MCSTFYIENEEVTTIGELKKFCEIDIDCIHTYKGDRVTRKEMLDELVDNECLCAIDPLRISLKLNSTVLCDEYMWEYTFQKRDN